MNQHRGDESAVALRVFVGKAHALLDQQKQHIQTILEDHHDVSQRRIKQWCGDATATADESMQSKLVAFAYSDGGTPEPEATTAPSCKL